MKAAEGYLLALDIGTTTTRCLLFDLEGIPVGAAYREPPIHYPRPSWTEVDPEDWWESAVMVVREVLEQTQVPRERILGIGLAGLMHALVPINEAGQPLARAMLWMDQRCRPQVEWLTRKHSQLIEEMTGPRWALSTTPSAPKLRWIVEHRPELLQQTYKFLLVKDFVRLKLTGTIATDHSDAGGTCLYDRQKGDWSRPMLNAIGVGLEKMPLIHESAEVIGAITEEAAQLTGLIQGTPVVVGGGDVMCTRIGADANGYERACLYLGTAAWVSVVSSDTGRAAVAATATTGASVKWLLALLRGNDPCASRDGSYASLLQDAADAPPGAKGLVFLPHLMGERGPRYDPEAKGVLFGLTLAHGRQEIARAVLEGCAFQLRSIVEGIDLTQIRDLVAVGGGAKSPLWLQIIADVTGVTLLTPRVLEAGALGAAVLAGVGVGVYSDVQEAAKAVVQTVGRYEPCMARREYYDLVYATFLELEDRVSPLFKAVPVGRGWNGRN